MAFSYDRIKYPVEELEETVEVLPNPHTDIIRDMLEINKMAMALNVEIFKALQPPQYIMRKSE